METWKNIKGYEGLYQVSDQGRVKSLERKDSWGRTITERILKPAPASNGYLVVTLYAGGKPTVRKVHRLVCQAFHQNQDNKPQVNHINEDKTDNRACNLEWCTAKENCNHGSRNIRRAKTQSKPVGQYTLDGELIKVWQSTSEAERQAGFACSNISSVANGKRKTHKGFIWRYV